jgi:hypothetical protein
MLLGLGFTKCYFDDIIVFNVTLGDHMHHMREVFSILKEHKFHPSKC